MDQTPSDVLEKQNSSRVNLSCEHQIPSYDTILWYRRSQGSNRLDLIAYVYYKQPTVEANFTGYFSVDGDGEKWSRLELLKPRSPEDTGEYYCAARMHCDEEPTYAATKTLMLPQERVKTLFPADVLNLGRGGGVWRGTFGGYKSSKLHDGVNLHSLTWACMGSFKFIQGNFDPVVSQWVSPSNEALSFLVA